MIIRCTIACNNTSGKPDFVGVTVECTEEEYNNGKHYESAKDWAMGNGYQSPFVVFDVYEAPEWLQDNVPIPVDNITCVTSA